MLHRVRFLAAALAAAGLFAACGDSAAAASRATGTNARGIPNVAMTDQHGRVVSLYDDVVQGRCVVIQFMYTQCDGVCPAATAALVEAQTMLGDQLGKDVFFVSISLDERDTAEDLAAYAETNGMGPGWTLLTGSKEDIEKVRRALGAYDPDPEVDAVRSNHSAGLVLGNDPKDRWTMASGLGSARALVRSIRRVL